MPPFGLACVGESNLFAANTPQKADAMSKKLGIMWIPGFPTHAPQ